MGEGQREALAAMAALLDGPPLLGIEPQQRNSPLPQFLDGIVRRHEFCQASQEGRRTASREAEQSDARSMIVTRPPPVVAALQLTEFGKHRCCLTIEACLRRDLLHAAQ